MHLQVLLFKLLWFTLVTYDTLKSSGTNFGKESMQCVVQYRDLRDGVVRAPRDKSGSQDMPGPSR